MGHAGIGIRAMRTGQGLTLRDLAKLSGTSPTHLSLVERGEREPSGRWLIAVTDALAAHLMEGTP